MTHDDDTIRRLLRDAAPASSGVTPESVARRVRAAERRRGRATLLAVPLATIATIAMAVAGVQLLRSSSSVGPSGQSTPTPSGSTASLVPWVDTPAQAYVPPTATSSAGPGATAPCNPGDLAARWERPNGATGHLFHPVALANEGATSCSVGGIPSVVASEPGLPDVTADRRPRGDATTVRLAPGEAALLWLETDTICAAHPGGGGQAVLYHSVAVALGDGTLSLPRNSDGLDLKCGLGVGGFTPSASPPTSPTPPDPLKGLTVEVDATSTRIMDGYLVYVVRLSNPTSEDISLARCPSYLETLTSEPSGNLVAKAGYQLNCTDVTVIQAGETVGYEMKLPAPDGIGGTPFTMTWALAGPSLPSGRSNVVIVGSQSATPTQSGTYDYTSPKGVTIQLDDFPSGRTISSPVTVTGEVPGSWSFEGDFPVDLVDSDGKVIARGIATLQGDWMTDKPVPFAVTLTFDSPTSTNDGTLVLHKNDPSGKASLQDAVGIPVTFG